MSDRHPSPFLLLPPSPVDFLAAILAPERRKLAVERADGAAVRANQDLIWDTPGLPHHGAAVAAAADLVRSNGGTAREALLAAAAAMECVCADFLLANGRRLAALEAFGFVADDPPPTVH